MVNKLSYYLVQEPKMIGSARVNKKVLSPLLNELATPILVPVNGHVGPNGVNVAPMVCRIDKEDVKIHKQTFCQVVLRIVVRVKAMKNKFAEILSKVQHLLFDIVNLVNEHKSGAHTKNI